MSVLPVLLVLLSAEPDFNRDVRPILAQKCFTCHGPDAGQRKAGLRLDLRKAATRPTESGTIAIVPGNSAKSALVQRILAQDPDERMPPPASKKRLTAREQQILQQWIAAGAKYNKHWSFVRPRKSTPPAVKSAWIRNDVDRFILARLQAAKMQPSPRADKVTLIRRLSFDLRGLPPEIAEVKQFLADKSSKAYERLVDRMLASPHYGERMAQDWLDLARYGDTNGFHADSDRDMWLYRDYVIKAFNKNKRFDRFIVENVAGDLLPKSTDETRIASGFNRCNTFNEEGGADPDEFYVAYAVDRANTTAQVFLGMTFGCAQCHDHKYDPLTQREYYQFYAFFNSVQGEVGAGGPSGYHNKPLPPLLKVKTAEYRKKLAELDKAIKRLEANLQAELVKSPRDKAFAKAFAAWLKKLTTDKPPKKDPLAPLRQIARTPAAKRTAAQAKQLSDHYARHIHPATKKRIQQLDKQLADARKNRTNAAKAIPSTLVMVEKKKRTPAYILVRGDFQQRAQKVQPDVPAIFPRLSQKLPRNRLALGHWLTDPAHPLVARVTVNRIWKQLFGTGLVKTLGDFGTQGESPSHQRLLDWLAVDFVEKGWNIKGLQKMIVMSSTYRQTSRVIRNYGVLDPNNRLLSRAPRFRLSAEEIRDTSLAISGLLNRKLGGPSVKPYQPKGYYADKIGRGWSQSKGSNLYRRGLYTYWRRTTLYPTFQIFDAPSREVCTVNRPRTNTPLQALVLMNDPAFVEAARVFGQRILKQGGKADTERLRFAFRTAVARQPDKREMKVLQAIINEQRQLYSKDIEAAKKYIRNGEFKVDATVNATELASWTALGSVLLNLDETITRE